MIFDRGKVYCKSCGKKRRYEIESKPIKLESVMPPITFPFAVARCASCGGYVRVLEVDNMNKELFNIVQAEIALTIKDNADYINDVIEA